MLISSRIAVWLPSVVAEWVGCLCGEAHSQQTIASSNQLSCRQCHAVALIVRFATLHVVYCNLTYQS